MNLLQREQPLIHVLPDHPSEHVRNDEIPQEECCWEKTGKSLLYLDVNNTDNRLKHDREMEIGESTLKNLKKLRQEQNKGP